MPAKTEPNVQIAKAASAMYSGADVSQPQLKLLLAYVKSSMRSGIIKHLACTETQLKRYATGDIANSELPEQDARAPLKRRRVPEAVVAQDRRDAVPDPQVAQALEAEDHDSRQTPSRR